MPTAIVHARHFPSEIGTYSDTGECTCISYRILVANITGCRIIFEQTSASPLKTPPDLARHEAALQLLDPLRIFRLNRSGEMVPRELSSQEARDSPLPPEGAEERHAMLPELRGRKQRHLERMHADEDEERPVLDVLGRQRRLGALEQVVVDRGAGGDELAA